MLILKSRRKKRKITVRLAFAKKKNENTTKILKYVFTTNSFRSAFADAVAAVCTFVCGSSHWTATGTRVYACIDLQNDNHARMMQIIHCREEKNLISIYRTIYTFHSHRFTILPLPWPMPLERNSFFLSPSLSSSW